MFGNVFKNMGHWTQLLFLCFFSFAGLMFGTFLSSMLGFIFQENVYDIFSQSLTFLRFSQVLVVICWLFLPSILFALLFKENLKSYFKVDKKISWVYILLIIALVLVIQPLVELSGYLNHQIPFPDSLSALEEMLQRIENSARQVMELFIADKSITGIISNVLIIAVLPALVEEVFFRGCLQQILLKIVKNIHLGVWLTAIIFSAVHMEFYGFIPRILLGAMLGYLFIWSGSLWAPILAHFVNNLGVIIMQQIYYGTPEYEALDNFDPQSNVIYIVLSVILTIVIGYFLSVKMGCQKDKMTISNE